VSATADLPGSLAELMEENRQGSSKKYHRNNGCIEEGEVIIYLSIHTYTYIRVCIFIHKYIYTYIYVCTNIYI
jgi:hypothetical protein